MADTTGMPSRIDARARELAAGYRDAIYRRTDRMFAGLLACEWVGMVALAVWVSPLTWAGTDSRVHPTSGGPSGSAG